MSHGVFENGDLKIRRNSLLLAANEITKWTRHTMLD